MTQGWIDAAREFAGTVEAMTSVAPREAFLNDRLLQFIYDPPNSDAARLMLIASQDELIVSAGRGTQFELDPLPVSETEVLQIVEAVVSGRFTERVKGSLVNSKLVLDDGTELKGRIHMGGWNFRKTREVIEYAPYER